MQQLGLDVRLQPLDQLGQCRLRRPQQVGGTGEGAGLDDANEGPHGRHLVHLRTPEPRYGLNIP